MHILMPYRVEFPQVREAGEERSGYLTQAVTILGRNELEKDKGRDDKHRVLLDHLPDGG